MALNLIYIFRGSKSSSRAGVLWNVSLKKLFRSVEHELTDCLGRITTLFTEPPYTFLLKEKPGSYCGWRYDSKSSVDLDDSPLLQNKCQTYIQAFTARFTKPPVSRFTDAMAPRGCSPIDGIWPCFPSQELYQAKAVNLWTGGLVNCAVSDI